MAARPALLLAFFAGLLCGGCDQITGLDDLEAVPDAPPATSPVAWSHHYGNSGDQRATAVAVAAARNNALARSIGGTLDLGGGPLSSPGGELFVAKLDPDGGHLWSKKIPCSVYSEVTSIAFTREGGVVLVGSFIGALELDDSQLSSPGNTHNTFVLELDTLGHEVWTAHTELGSNDGAKGVAIDDDGRVVVVGTFVGTEALEVHTKDGLAATLPGGGSGDGYLLVLDHYGRLDDAIAFGDGENQVPTSVAVTEDPIGRRREIVVTGTNWGRIDVGDTSLVSAGAADLFLLNLGPSLTPRWGATFGSVDSNCHDVCETTLTAAPGGGVYLAGAYTGSVSFGGGVLDGNALADLVVARYDAFGTSGAPKHLWSERFGDALGEQRVYGSAVGTSGDLVLTGMFDGTLDLGPAGTLVGEQDFVKDLFVAVLDPDGTPRRSMQLTNTDAAQDLGTRDRENGLFVAAAPDGSFVVAGSFRGSLSLDGRTLVAADTAANYDVLIAKVRP